MDQSGIAFLDIIFFAMVAGFLILRLRSVLGRRTGDENAERWRAKKPEQVPPAATPAGDNVVRFPDAASAPAEAAAPPAPGSVEAGIAEIQSADPGFDAAGFAQGARRAFEMIVAAFAQGDAAGLRPLLADPVNDSFAQAIRDRQGRGWTLATTLIGIRSADIVAARMRGRDALVTIRFVSDQVNVTRDAAGEVMEGDPTKVETITDIWTFSRDTRGRDPNWFLAETATA
ncbi:MAG: Tim44/TimA family putative adaptor protein [Rhodospirillales bacterium]|jgi:predicted lipid-binding transport protein (Tim44 family)